MAKDLPQIEDSTITQYIPPKGAYLTFENEEEFLAFTRKWGLNTATSTKTKFWYKESYYKREVEIVGYEQYKNGYDTLVIRFNDGNLCCINPMFLKDMQKSTFGEEVDDEAVAEQVKQAKKSNASKPAQSEGASTGAIALPTGKVTFKGTLERFDEVYNAFTEKDEPIALWRDVELDEGKVKVPFAWCGYSKTLEKLNLVEGTVIECLVEATKRKFKDVSDVKVNRPSKIKVLSTS